MRKLLLVVALLGLFVPMTNAEPIVIGGDSNFVTWNANQLNGGAFWAGPSYDGNRLANIGYYLSGTPGSNIPGFYDLSPNAFLPYLGIGESTFSFQTNQSESVTFLQGVSALTSDFGWFDVETRTSHSLFNKNGQRGTSHQFAPTNNYGFYLNSPALGMLYSTDLYKGRSHFALFKGAGGYYLGIEDIAGNSDWDFNDLIVWIPDSTPTSVPEPASLTLLGLGLMGLGIKFRRRK